MKKKKAVMAKQHGRKRGAVDLATQTKPNKKAMQRQARPAGANPEKAEIEEESGSPDAEAVLLVKNELNLTEKEAAVLKKAIFKLKDDLLMVIKKTQIGDGVLAPQLRVLSWMPLLFTICPECSAEMTWMAADDGFFSSETVRISTHAKQLSELFTLAPLLYLRKL